MGQNVNNVELVTDYSEGRSFIRLHRDIVLPDEICESIRRLLGAGEWERAKAVALEHAPVDTHEELILFFTSVAADCTA